MKTAVRLPLESLRLARRTLRNTTLNEESALLVKTDVEDVAGVPTIYFDFQTPRGTTRVYADES